MPARVTPIAKSLAAPVYGRRTPPPFVDQMLFRYDDESPVYSDFGGTQLQKVDGGNVKAIRSTGTIPILAPLIYNSTAATYQAKTYGGRQSVKFNGSAFSFGVKSQLEQVVNNSVNWALFFLLKINATGTNQILWQNTSHTQCQVVTSTSQVMMGGFTSGVLPSDYSTNPHTYGFIMQNEWGSGSDGARLCVAGAPVGTTAIPTNTSNAAEWVLGGLLTGAFRGYDLHADVLAAIILSRQLKPHEFCQLSDHYYARFGLTNPRAAATKVVVWQTNSIAVLNQSPQLPELVRANLGYPIGSSFHLGQTSKSWPTMNNEGPEYTDPLLKYLKNSPIGPGDPVYVQWEGVNNTTPSTGYTDLDNRVAAGGVRKARCIMANVIAKSSAAFPTWAATQSAENSDIAANYATHAGYEAIPASDAVLGYGGTPNGMGDTTYSPDGTHLTQAGANVAVPYFATAIGAV